MIENLRDIGLLTALVYAIVESLEKFGIKKKYAHILALPIGVAISFLVVQSDSIEQKIIYGLIVGILSVGSCDTICNTVNIFKKEDNKDTNNKQS